MINNIYTVLMDLIRDNDKDLKEFLGQYTYTSVKSRYSGGGAPSGFTSFITMAPVSATRETAKVSVVKILEAIERGVTCSETSADNLMASYLTRKGCAEFWKFLRQKGALKDVEFAEEFTSSADDLQALFRGMPTYRIVVSDTLGKEASRGHQRFTIELENRKTNVRKEIRFPNNDCYLLYLWFLMHPRQMIRKPNIQDRFGDFGVLAKKMYLDTKKIDEKITSYHNDPSNKLGRKNGFEMFFTQNLNKVNKAIREVLGPNEEEGWYIIGHEVNDKDTDQEEGYSISLTDEKRYIDLPNVLERLKYQFNLSDKIKNKHV